MSDVRASRRDVVVALDANGADMGPREVAAGAALAAREGVRVLLFGPAAEIGAVADGVELIDAPLSIAKSADPARAVRSSPQSSIVQAYRAVAQGRAQALVCAGGTGAALAAGLFNLKRAKGIHRPALALPLPVPGGPLTLLDVGANAQARSEHLVQFAFMGAAFAQSVLCVRAPRVGLLSNGEERTRGSETVMRACEQLMQRMTPAEPVPAAGGATAASAATGAMPDAATADAATGAMPDAATADAATGAATGVVPGAATAGAMRFVGNVEGDDVVSGVADVIVTDGFTGNVALKLMEGVSQTMLASIRETALSSARARLGGLLLLPALRAFREQIDPEAQGGAYLLGLRGPVVVPHGRFARRGFAQALLRARRAVQEDVAGSTHAALLAAGALRRAPLSADAASLTSER